MVFFLGAIFIFFIIFFVIINVLEQNNNFQAREKGEVLMIEGSCIFVNEKQFEFSFFISGSSLIPPVLIKWIFGKVLNSAHLL